MADTLQLLFLGGLQVKRGDAAVTGFVSAKVQALLCYLAMTRREHSRDALAGLFWGDLPDADAKTNLRQALANLRKLLEPHLLISRDAVEFNRAAPYWLDVEEFSKIGNWRLELGDWTQPPSSKLQALSSLYRGDFLEGFFVRDAPDFEEWALAQRARLRDLAAHALQTLAAHHVARGEYANAIEHTTRLLALDPWREEAHRELMLLFARMGQRSAALAQFETCRRVLQEQMGVEPDAATVALAERIRAARSAPPRNLPAQPTSFVGRANDIAQIESRLLTRECRLLTLVGLGGIGKTRLALQSAEHLANIGAFLDGVFFAPLASLNVDSTDALVFALADACGLTLKSGDPQTQLGNYLRDKEILFVLDNFEHLLAHVGLLTQLLKRGRDLKLLVTSRERLNVQWEWLFEVEGLTAEPAAQLFSERARQVEPRFSFAENQAHIARICQLVQGMPLGIELASAWVNARACADIAREIERTFDFLATTMRDAPDRQRSLRAVFDYSWQMLSAEEQRVFRALSVFRGGFTRDASEQVAGATASALAALVTQSLVRHDPNERYEMHEAVRQFAAEKFSTPDERIEIVTRHAEYFVTLVQTAESKLKGPEQVEWLNRLEQEIDNARAALHWATHGGDTVIGLRLAASMYQFWAVRGHFTEGRQWLRELLALTPHTDDPERLSLMGQALRVSGVLASNQADYAEAKSFHQQALAIRRQLQDKPGIAATLNSLAIIAQHQSDLELAQRLQEESLALKRELNDKPLIALSLNNLAVISTKLGDYARAQAYLEESLAILRAAGDKRNVAGSLNNLGEIAALRRDYARAVSLFEESLVLKRELKDKQGIAISLEALGEIVAYQGDAVRARAWLEESLVLFREMGDQWGIALALNALADLAVTRGHYVSASAMYRESLALRHARGEKDGIAFCLEGLAGLACARNDFERATRLLGAADTIRESINTPRAPIAAEQCEHYIAGARAKLGDTQFAHVLAQGRALTLEQAVALGLPER